MRVALWDTAAVDEARKILFNRKERKSLAVIEKNPATRTNLQTRRSGWEQRKGVWVSGFWGIGAVFLQYYRRNNSLASCRMA